MPRFTHTQDTVVVAAGHAIRFSAGTETHVPDDAALIRAVQAAGAVASDKPAEPAGTEPDEQDDAKPAAAKSAKAK